MVFVNNQPDNVCSQQLSKINLDYVNTVNDEEEINKLKDKLSYKNFINWNDFDHFRNRNSNNNNNIKKKYLINNINKILNR